MQNRKLLGELLLAENIINPNDLRNAIEYQKRNGGLLGMYFVRYGIVSSMTIMKCLSKQ